MTLSFIYWFCLFLWLLNGFYVGWKFSADGRYYVVGGSVLLFILFLVIGLKEFGFPIRGG